MLEPRALQIFVALAEDLHFGHAAERLNISQSTLSLQLQRLEAGIGAPLLHRRKRSAVRLTQTGEVFLAEARASLDRLEQAEHTGRMAARGEAGPLAIGYVFSAALSGVLPTALKHLKRALPHLELSVALSETPKSITAVRERKMDIGFIRARPFYPPRMVTHGLLRENLVLCISERHPLARSAAAAPEALKRERFILPQFDDRHGILEKLHALARAGGFDAEGLIRTRDYVTAASMAAGEMGVVLAPRSLCKIGISGLRFLEINDFGEQLEIVMISRAEPFSVAGRAFEALKTLPQTDASA